MTPLFKKLNLGGIDVVHVLNAPASFEPELIGIAPVVAKRSLSKPVRFVLAFVITRADLDHASTQIANATAGDAIVWMVYPKGSSKKYRCEFNRDSGWEVLGAAGFEPVRMVAVDEDWSALRFRRAEHIKSMTRNAGSAISAAGKRKAASR